MSRNYDNWEKLVGAVLRREKDRQLALCESFSTSTSLDFGSRSSFFSIEDDDVVPAGVGRSLGQRFNPEYLSSQSIFFARNVKGIEYEEIRKATRNFHIHEGIVATNLFPPVYKGWIHEEDLTAMKPGCGIAVAVHIMYLEGFQQYKELVVESLEDYYMIKQAKGFDIHQSITLHYPYAHLQDEINYWSPLCHPNLVKLVGCSFDSHNRILVVHEFMGRGSLDNALRSKGERALFSWAKRVAVAVGAARALAFLHDSKIPAMNRSITSSNILLDGEFNAKLMYFCLRKDGPARAMGGFGYDAPEYTETGSFTSKSDVYSFGLILLELMSGLRLTDKNWPKDMHNLMDWAKPYLSDKNRAWGIMDRGLEGQYTRKKAYTVRQLVLKCVSSDPRLRPKMSEVVAVLETL